MGCHEPVARAYAAADSERLKMTRIPRDLVGMTPAMANRTGLIEVGRLQLNHCQHQQVLSIQDKLRRDDWRVMGKMYDEMAALRKAMWPSERSHRLVVAASNKRMSKLRHQMLENALLAAETLIAILTSDQRAQLRRSTLYCLNGTAGDTPRKRPRKAGSADPPNTPQRTLKSL